MPIMKRPKSSTPAASGEVLPPKPTAGEVEVKERPVTYTISDSLSSVQIEKMSAGNPKVTVKVYEGTTEKVLTNIMQLAVKTYKRANAKLAQD